MAKQYTDPHKHLAQFVQSGAPHMKLVTLRESAGQLLGKDSI